MHRGFVSNSAFIVHSLFGIAKGTPVGRLSITSMVFVISGVMHAAGVRMVGPNCKGGPVIWYYCITGLGIIFEDSVEMLYSRMFGDILRSPASRRLDRVVGYMWTILFMSWRLPKLLFANASCERR